VKRALLDVNVLIALLDPLHIHAPIAHKWFDENEGAGWASCPVTQNGYVRIVSHPSYGAGLSVVAAADLLRDLTSRPSHEFWPDDLSILDARLFDLSKVGSGRHLTDTYLLGLAKHRDGHLVSLDGRLSTIGVERGHASLTIIA